MKDNQVVILGAGLTGLSCAYHLRKAGASEPFIIDKNNSIGGTARSFSVDGFTFDMTGHLLHLHNSYTKKLIGKLLKNNLNCCTRNAAIYSHNVLTPYPFQVHTYGLPKKIIQECVNGFAEAVRKYSDSKMRVTSLPFSVWSKRTFGDGIHKYFMKPYNEKLWQVSADKMTAEWCGMFVPQPKLEDVIKGSKESAASNLGYNATFLYPKKGGIQTLVDALGKDITVKFNTSFEKILWKEKKIKLSNGQWFNYRYLVSSVPLVELLKRMDGLPQKIQRLIPFLRWSSVIDVNLGVSRSDISDKSWIYFPEKKFMFYRVGFPMNFTPYVVPKGCSSMYVEIPHIPTEKINWKSPDFLKRLRKELEDCGILKKSDKIVTTHIVPIEYAYVVYTLKWKSSILEIIRFLEENDILPAGRYGAWKYSFMEENILDGKKAAEKILSRN